MGFELICSAAAAVFLPASLVWVCRRRKRGRSARAALLTQIACFAGVSAAVLAFGAGSALAADGGMAAAGTAGAISDAGMGFLSAALATGLSGIGGGVAVASAASAALGAISENERMFGRSMIFVGLAEGIALYGLIISLMILSRI
ncbi:MAG: ATP synthase subunit C [Oscillospiraceae bacterium]|nr:ATP synthase subunit C [Oscillospiraceae bacterium]